VDFDVFKGLIRVVGTLEAKSPPVLSGAAVVLGSVLAPVATIITVLRDLHLPLGLAAGMVASDQQSGAWKQGLVIDVVKVLQKLLPPPPPAVPGKEADDDIDLGFCKLRKGKIAVEMLLSFCGKERASVAFEIEGEMQQSVLGNLLYAGGYFDLEIAFEVEEKIQDGVKTSEEKTEIELAAAAAGSVGGQLIPNSKIAKVEGSVRYGYLLEADMTNWPPVIRPGVIVGLE